MARLKTLGNRINSLNPARVQTMQAGSWRTSEMTSAQRGYGYRWQKAREGYLRSHPLCVMCQARGLVEPSTIVDHVIPHQGDQQLFWDKTNWQALCKPCHDGEKQRQERRST